MIIDGLIERVIGLKITFDNLNDFYFSREIVAKIDLRVYRVGEQPSIS
jgi:hypothetical protein